ncbi:glycoside hydrolase family 25 protein [Lactarius hengduanensis]|nr:glycoside hydrolase family 25 protein [Lactarius hengduanensis]
MLSLLQILALSTLSLSLIVSGAPGSGGEPTLVKRADPQGIDVSHFQGTLNWNTIKSQGVVFAYIKATEGTTFIDPNFSSNYVGATNAAVYAARITCHPDTSIPAVRRRQPSSSHTEITGGWSGDGITLPGALDLEGTCYGLTAAQMVAWIQDFSNTYHSATARFPTIYTTTSWWTSCTGNSAAFSSNALWIAHWATTIGTLPASWGFTTFWQYADSGPFPGDQDRFNGDAAGLSSFASG